MAGVDALGIAGADVAEVDRSWVFRRINVGCEAFQPLKNTINMKTAKQRFAFLILFLLWVGCLGQQTKKYYDFSEAQIAFDQKDMAVSARIVGTPSSDEKEGREGVIIRKSPYTLSFLVTSRTGYYRDAKVSNIWITGEKNEHLVSGTLAPAGANFSESQAGYEARVFFPRLVLPSERVNLTADLEIMTQSNSIIRQKISFELAPSVLEETVK
jgi:hypothetical protein